MYETIIYENTSYFSLLSIYESNDYKHFFKFKGHTKYTNVFEIVRRSVDHRNIPSDMYILIFRKNYAFGVPYINHECLCIIIKKLY